VVEQVLGRTLGELLPAWVREVVTALRKKHPAWFVEDLGALFALAARGTVKPRVAERIAFEAVADAHVCLERGGLEGKIVLLPNG
jgi:NADPH2:quinone reductase